MNRPGDTITFALEVKCEESQDHSATHHVPMLTFLPDGPQVKLEALANTLGSWDEFSGAAPEPLRRLVAAYEHDGQGRLAVFLPQDAFDLPLEWIWHRHPAPLFVRWPQHFPVPNGPVASGCGPVRERILLVALCLAEDKRLGLNEEVLQLATVLGSDPRCELLIVTEWGGTSASEGIANLKCVSLAEATHRVNAARRETHTLAIAHIIAHATENGHVVGAPRGIDRGEHLRQWLARAVPHVIVTSGCFGWRILGLRLRGHAALSSGEATGTAFLARMGKTPTAVVATCTKIRSHAATEFARSFYSSLLAGRDVGDSLRSIQNDPKHTRLWTLTYQLAGCADFAVSPFGKRAEHPDLPSSTALAVPCVATATQPVATDRVRVEAPGSRLQTEASTDATTPVGHEALEGLAAQLLGITGETDWDSSLLKKYLEAIPLHRDWFHHLDEMVVEVRFEADGTTWFSDRFKGRIAVRGNSPFIRDSTAVGKASENELLGCRGYCHRRKEPLYLRQVLREDNDITMDLMFPSALREGDEFDVQWESRWKTPTVTKKDFLFYTPRDRIHGIDSLVATVRSAWPFRTVDLVRLKNGELDVEPLHLVADRDPDGLWVFNAVVSPMSDIVLFSWELDLSLPL
jgi:hypothetical protein